MDIEITEEDSPAVEIPFGWEQSTMTAEEKAKYDEAVKDDGVTDDTPGAKPLEQVAEPEITAEDLPVEPTPQEVRKLKVALPDGEVELDEAELVKGYMRQADYTRKTQEAARLRADAEAMREAMAFYQPEPPVYQPPYQAQIGEPEFQTPTEKMLYDELQAVKGQVGSLAKAREGDLKRTVFNQLDSEIKGFREAHPELGEEQMLRIVSALNEDGSRPTKKAFERIYKAEFIDPQKIADEAVAKYVKTLREKKKAAVAPSVEPGNAKPEPLDVRSMTDEQRHEAMLRDFLGT